MAHESKHHCGTLGIYGGTFSPPHIAHISVVKSFIEQLSPDRLLVIPAGIPPHKSVENDDPEARLEMCEATFLPVSDKVEVSDYELKKAGKSYTSDTLHHFSAMADKLYLICGGDMFLTLDTWHEPETIFALATVVCAYRGGIPDVEYDARACYYKEKYGADIMSLHMDKIKMSSSEIRESYKRGGDISDCVTPETLEIIKSRGLYV